MDYGSLLVRANRHPVEEVLRYPGSIVRDILAPSPERAHFSQVPIFGDPRMPGPETWGGVAVGDPPVGTTDVAPRRHFRTAGSALEVPPPARVHSALSSAPHGQWGDAQLGAGSTIDSNPNVSRSGVPKRVPTRARQQAAAARTIRDRLSPLLEVGGRIRDTVGEAAGDVGRAARAGLGKIAEHGDALGDYGAALAAAGGPTKYRVGFAGRAAAGLAEGRARGEARASREHERALEEAGLSLAAIRTQADLERAQASRAKANEPKTRSRVDGGEMIYEQKVPGGAWEEVSRGPRWNPNAGDGGAGSDNRIQAARKLIEGLSPAQRESIADPFFANEMGPTFKQALYWSTRPLTTEDPEVAAAWAAKYAIPQDVEAPAEESAAPGIFEDEEPPFWSGLVDRLRGLE